MTGQEQIDFNKIVISLLEQVYNDVKLIIPEQKKQRYDLYLTALKEINKC